MTGGESAVHLMHIPQDGWIKTCSGALILWVPPQYSHAVGSDSSIMTLPRNAPNHPINMDFTHLRIGKDWINIRAVDN